MKLEKSKLNISFEFTTMEDDIDNFISEIESQVKAIEMSPKYNFVAKPKITLESFETDKVEGNDWEYETYVNINPKNILITSSDSRNNPFID